MKTISLDKSIQYTPFCINSKKEAMYWLHEFLYVIFKKDIVNTRICRGYFQGYKARRAPKRRDKDMLQPPLRCAPGLSLQEGDLSARPSKIDYDFLRIMLENITHLTS